MSAKAKLDQSKKAQIIRANSNMVVWSAVAVFVLVFTLVSSHALVGQIGYQNNVIKEKKKALQQLEANMIARDELVTAYKAFVSTPQNLIGGNPAGSGDRDGDNAKIMLDALPGRYDFPRLTSSIEKIALDQKLEINSISGIDDQVQQSQLADSTTPEAVTMPFSVGVSSAQPNIQAFLVALESSIRPIQVGSIELAIEGNKLNLTINGETYYQPGIVFEVEKKVLQ